jgi:hypothetical protein
LNFKRKKEKNTRFNTEKAKEIKGETKKEEDGREMRKKN